MRASRNAGDLWVRRHFLLYPQWFMKEASAGSEDGCPLPFSG